MIFICGECGRDWHQHTETGCLACRCGFRASAIKRMGPDPEEPSVLDEAAGIVNGGPRDQAYGHPGENFTRIATMWSAYLGKTVTAHDVCMLMILLKTTRAAHGYHRDTDVDICGYARCDERVAGWTGEVTP